MVKVGRTNTAQWFSKVEKFTGIVLYAELIKKMMIRIQRPCLTLRMSSIVRVPGLVKAGWDYTIHGLSIVTWKALK